MTTRCLTQLRAAAGSRMGGVGGDCFQDLHVPGPLTSCQWGSASHWHRVRLRLLPHHVRRPATKLSPAWNGAEAAAGCGSWSVTIASASGVSPCHKMVEIVSATPAEQTVNPMGRGRVTSSPWSPRLLARGRSHLHNARTVRHRRAPCRGRNWNDFDEVRQATAARGAVAFCSRRP